VVLSSRLTQGHPAYTPLKLTSIRGAAAGGILEIGRLSSSPPEIS
jgi:hypothetical protein